MLRTFRPGFVLVLALAAGIAAAYPKYAVIVTQAIHTEHCESAPACSRVTGVALPAVPNVTDRLFHHPPSTPTR